jgi:simple sugar transport system permease protein
MISIPVMTFVAVGLLCVGMIYLLKTKLGQDFRAVGQSQQIARVAGINVDKVRILAIVFSTVLAALGQIIFLQNLGILTTYGSHVQVGTFAVAAILIGGASVSKATIGQALLGTFLFHTLFIVSPLAGKNLMGNPQVGEFFRVFVAYGVIGVALALHAWKGRGK